MKGNKYAKTLAKIQVRAILHIWDIRRNVLPEFIELCMETPVATHPDGHQHGSQKPTETSVYEFYLDSVNHSGKR